MGRRLKIIKNSRKREKRWQNDPLTVAQSQLENDDAVNEEMMDLQRMYIEQQVIEYLEMNPHLLITPRMYQQLAFLDSIKNPHGNGLVVLPTGMGKTIIMAMHVHHFLKKEQNWLEHHSSESVLPRKILIVAPTKPLVEQLYQRLTMEYLEGMPEERVVMLTGVISPQQRQQSYPDAWIILSTPQTIQNDVKNSILSWNEVGLCLIDEVHHARKNHSMAWIIRQYMEHVRTSRDSLVLCQSEDEKADVHDERGETSSELQRLPPRIVGFSASPGNDIKQVRELVNLLQADGHLNLAVLLPDSPLLKVHSPKIRNETIKISLPLEYHEAMRLINELSAKYQRKVKILLGTSYPSKFSELMDLFSQILRKHGQKSPAELQFLRAMSDYLRCRFLRVMIETQGFPPLEAVLKSWHEKALTSRGLSQFMSTPQMRQFYQLVTTTSLPHPKVERLLSIVKQLQSENPQRKIIIFVSYRSTIHYLSEVFNAHHVAHAVLLGKSRDPPHLSRHLPSKGRISAHTLEEFRETDVVNVLLTTSVGEEGLDIGTCDVVIHHDIPNSPLRLIQRRGRARQSSALIYYLVTKETSDERHYHSLMKKQEHLLEHVKMLQQQEIALSSSSQDLDSATHGREESTSSLEMPFISKTSLISQDEDQKEQDDVTSRSIVSDFLVRHGQEVQTKENSSRTRVIYIMPESLELNLLDSLKVMDFEIKLISSPDDAHPLQKLDHGHGIWIKPDNLMIMIITPLHLLELAENGLDQWLNQLDARASTIEDMWIVFSTSSRASLPVSSRLLMNFHVKLASRGYPLVVPRDDVEFEAFVSELLSHFSRKAVIRDEIMKNDASLASFHRVHVQMLSCIPGISPRKARIILSHVAFHQLPQTPEEVLQQIPGIGARLAKKIKETFRP